SWLRGDSPFLSPGGDSGLFSQPGWPAENRLRVPLPLIRGRRWAESGRHRGPSGHGAEVGRNSSSGWKISTGWYVRRSFASGSAAADARGTPSSPAISARATIAKAAFGEECARDLHGPGHTAESRNSAPPASGGA